MKLKKAESNARKTCSTRRSLVIIALFMFMALGARAAWADGMLIPGPWIHGDRPEPDAPFSVKYHKVSVDIKDQAVVTSVDQMFHNETDRSIEATYLFPVPAGATISRFSMVDGDRNMEAKMLSREEARRIYEEIVRRRRDPALLEYYERDVFRASLFPIEGHGDRKLTLRYDQLSDYRNGVYGFVYPLDTERFSSKPIKNISVTVNLHTTKPLKSIYSPSHDVSIHRIDDHNARVSYEVTDSRPDRDFAIYYTVSADDVGLSLLTNRADGEDGYFLLLAAPKVKASERPVPKDIVFVFDRTGSMSGEKIEQARNALRFCLDNLNPEDRFNVIAFNETPDPLFDGGLAQATQSNVDKARTFVKGLDAEGSTDIDAALRAAGRQFRNDKRPSFVLFLTDGLPTAGETDPDAILKNAVKANDRDARFFNFGVGYDVNVPLLDNLAQRNHGVSEYVRPAENIESKVSALYRMIRDPVLSNVKVDFGGLRAYDIFPGDLPDIFRGSQIIVAGRFRGGGDVTVKLSGDAESKTQSFTLRRNVPENSPEGDFIPRLWAGRKIGYLLDQVRLHGRSDELVNEIVRLSKRYGIITEYTSFLVEEPAALTAAPEEQADHMDRYLKKAEAAKVSGSWAVSQSANANAMQAGGNAFANSFVNAAGETMNMNDQVRISGNNAYFQQGSNWIDSRALGDKPKKAVLTVKVFSAAYFKLLEIDATAGNALSQGKQVLLSVNGNAVQVDSEGVETLTSDQEKMLRKKSK